MCQASSGSSFTVYSLETIQSSAKSDAIAANDKLLLFRPTECGPVPPLSGVCGEHESNIELAANFCFTGIGGFLANQTGSTPLTVQNDIQLQKYRLQRLRQAARIASYSA